MIDRNRLAAYLDEAGDDPASSCLNLVRHHIGHVCLRQLWTGNVLDVSDQAIQKVKALLDGHSLRVATICTDLGRVSVNDLLSIPQQRLDRLFLLAKYFQSPTVVLRCGRRDRSRLLADMDDLQVAREWMSQVQDRALSANVVPLLEPAHDHLLYNPADIAGLLSAFPRWRVLYDPAQIILQRRIDPFVTHWTLLKDRVAAFDIHDVQVGQSFRPPGQGDCQLSRTLTDSFVSGYGGWYWLEPGLGRRYGQALTREATFSLAVGAFNTLERELNDVD